MSNASDSSWSRFVNLGSNTRLSIAISISYFQKMSHDITSRNVTLDEMLLLLGVVMVRLPLVVRVLFMMALCLSFYYIIV